MGILDEEYKKWKTRADKINNQHYGPNDSLLYSAVTHPVEGAEKLAKWLTETADTAYYGSVIPGQQAKAITDLVGLVPTAGLLSNVKPLLSGKVERGVLNTGSDMKEYELLREPQADPLREYIDSNKAMQGQLSAYQKEIEDYINGKSTKRPNMRQIDEVLRRLDNMLKDD